MESIGIDINVAAKFKFAAWSADSSTEWKSHEEEVKYFEKSSKNIQEIYIGSNPPKSGDWHDW